jgi:hypothetical protein
VSTPTSDTLAAATAALAAATSAGRELQVRPHDELLPWQAAVPTLAAAYRSALLRIRTAMAVFIRRQFHHSGRYSGPDAEAFSSVVVPVVRGAQQAVSQATSAYLNRVTSAMAGTSPPPPVSVPVSEVGGPTLRHGVDPQMVYRRPYATVWTDLAAGKPLSEAVDDGERRALDLVATDLQLAKTHTSQHVIAADERAVAWRRVPQGAYTCALCLIASTRVYHKGNLMAIHPNCDCDVEPVTSSKPFDQWAADDVLDAVHAAIRRDLGPQYVAASGAKGRTKARQLDYRDIVVVHQHGEIGPVLGVRGQHFTGPAEIARLTKHPVRKRKP